jgi:hypothetical protein
MYNVIWRRVPTIIVSMEKYVFVALGIQHTMNVIGSLPGTTIFFYIFL